MNELGSGEKSPDLLNVSALRLKKIFEDILESKSDRPHPTDDDYAKLADEIYFILHGIHPNASAHAEDELIARVTRAGDNLLAEIERWSDHVNGKIYPEFQMISENLMAMGMTAKSYSQGRIASSRGRGRPVSAWHSYGRRIGIAVKVLLEKIGYKKTVSLQSRDGAVAAICAEIVSDILGLTDKNRLQATAFTAAMSGRKRSAAGPNGVAYFKSLLRRFGHLTPLSPTSDQEEP